MNLLNKLKEWWNKVINPKTISDKMKLTPAISDKMTNHIQLWFNLYTGMVQHDESKNVLHSLNLPYTIADEKARMATLELKSEVIDPNSDEVKENSRADYINKQYKNILKDIRHKLTPGVALGTMVIKPIPNIEDKTIYFTYVLANEFYPISFNEKGKLIHGVFVEQIRKKDVTYTRLETHELKSGTITVTNEAFKSISTSTDLGTRINLTDVPEWQNLTSQISITSTNGIKLDRLLVATFVMPNANFIDVHSKMGMSGFGNVVNLIKDADNLYSSLLWEMEAGEMALDVPFNCLQTKLGKNEAVVLSKKQKRLYREVNVNTSSGGDIFNTHNPQLRDASYLNVLNNILMSIEDGCGLSRGSLSNAEEAAKTATEIKALKQRTYQSNKSIQEALQETLEDVIYIIDIYATLYNFAPNGEYKSFFEWDDSILVDVAEELRQRNSIVALGGMYPEEVSSWYLGQDLETRFREVESYKALKEQFDPEPEEDNDIA